MEGSIVESDTLVGGTYCHIATLLQCIVRLFERPLLKLVDTVEEQWRSYLAMGIWAHAWPSPQHAFRFQLQEIQIVESQAQSKKDQEKGQHKFKNKLHIGII